MLPLARRETGPLGATIFLALAAIVIGGIAWAVFSAPSLGWIFGPAVMGYGLLVIRSRRYWRRLAEERREESICVFARALHAKRRDTWVVRAVYEELSLDRGVSICPFDCIEKDLGFVPEDFESCLERIARRAGRSMNDIEKNPFFGRVTTVADAVSLLEAQPRT